MAKVADHNRHRPDRSMRRMSIFIALFAWLLTSGTHWQVVQGVGWSGMILRYSRTMSWAEAVRLTFQPDNLCGLCEFVADAHTRDRDGSNSNQPLSPSVSAKKYFPTLPVTAAAPAPGRASLCIWPLKEQSTNGRDRTAPPHDPPRVA